MCQRPMSTEPAEVLSASRSLMDEGRFEEALRLLAPALASHPQNPLLLWRQADLLSRSGRLADALESGAAAVTASDSDQRIVDFVLRLVDQASLEGLPAHLLPASTGKWPVAPPEATMRDRPAFRLSANAIRKREAPTVGFYDVLSRSPGDAAERHVDSMTLRLTSTESVETARQGPPWVIAGTDSTLTVLYLMKSPAMDAVRAADPAHRELADTAAEVAELPRWAAQLDRWPSLDSIRYVFSPGMSGSNLLASRLRTADLPVLSEPAMPFHIASSTGQSTRHLISDDEAASLCAAAIASHLPRDSNRPVVILPACAINRPEGLLRAQDDAVFLWRDSDQWFASLHSETGTTPQEAVTILARMLQARAFLAEAGQVVSDLWFEALANDRDDLIREAFSGLLTPANLTSDASSSNARARRSGVSRDAGPVIQPEMIKDFRWVLGQSPARVLARDLGLERLFDDALVPTPRRTLPSDGEMERGIPVLAAPHWGSVEHYYHFLLGYLLPFLAATHAERRQARFLVRDCGPMTAHFSILEEWCVNIIDREELASLAADPRAVAPRGFDHVRRYRDPALRQAIAILLDLLHVRCRTPAGRDRLLLINRAAPDPYYSTDRSEVKSAGSERRSIPNIDELAEELAEDWNVSLVTLEGLSLSEQARLFRTADVIVAQHGAALANIVFCTPETRIVEIDPHRGNSIFGDLASVIGAQYARVEQDGPHTVAEYANLRGMTPIFRSS